MPAAALASLVLILIGGATAVAAERLKELGVAALKDERKLDTRYGAECNPTGSPIGGGKGYARIFTSGDYEVGTLAELDEALERISALSPDERQGKVSTMTSLPLYSLTANVPCPT